MHAYPFRPYDDQNPRTYDTASIALTIRLRHTGLWLS